MFCILPPARTHDKRLILPVILFLTPLARREFSHARLYLQNLLVEVWRCIATVIARLIEIVEQYKRLVFTLLGPILEFFLARCYSCVTYKLKL